MYKDKDKQRAYNRDRMRRVRHKAVLPDDIVLPNVLPSVLPDVIPNDNVPIKPVRELSKWERWAGKR